MSAEPLSHWVFLRGLARESAHWDAFPAVFARTVSGARVHLLDLPGNGEHWRLDTPWSIGEIVEFCRNEALARLAGERPAPVYLLSISLGGMVAVEWACRYPKEIAGAVLINTSLRGYNRFYQRLYWKAWPLFFRTLLARGVEQRERLILELTSALSEHSRDLLEARVQTQEQRPVRASNLLRQIGAASRYRPPPVKPPVPLLLLNSAGDRLVDPDCSAAIARRWAAPLQTHPWAGHDLPLDDPEWTATAVKAWLQGMGAAAECR